MPAAFIVATVLLLLGTAAIVFAPSGYDNPESRRGAQLLGAAVLVAAGIMLAYCVTVVNPTRTVSVYTSFGKPDENVDGNGLHFVAPWKKTHRFDTSLQILDLAGTGKDDETKCVTVRLGSQSEACIDADIQWQIDPDGDVVELYRVYKSFDNIETKLIRNQIQRALNRTYQDFNPLSGLNGDNDTPTRGLDDLSNQAQKLLQDAVGSGIRIRLVTIHRNHYDDTTQRKLNEYQTEAANTRIAEQRKKTAEQTRQANEELAKSDAVDSPGVQYRACLDMLADLAAKDQLKDLPPAFTCGGGSDTPVILDGR